MTDATFIDYTLVQTGVATDAAERLNAFASVEESQSRRDNFTAIAGIRGAVDRNWSGTVEFRYRRTEARDRGIDRPEVDTYFLLFTLEYFYDPLQF